MRLILKRKFRGPLTGGGGGGGGGQPVSDRYKLTDHKKPLTFPKSFLSVLCLTYDKHGIVTTSEKSAI